MPYTRPTLNQLLDQSASEAESRLPGVIARLRRSLVGVVVRVIAAGQWNLYGYAEWLDRQKWPGLCEAEYLDWHGARWGVTRKPAAAAAGTVRFTGTNTTNVPIDTVVQRADGEQYKTTAAGVITGGEALIAAVAVVSGRDGNALVNTGVNLVTPIAGINTVATAHTALTSGSDIEGDESYRSRILLRIRMPPQGGAAHDYQQWALEVAGVTRAWVYPLEDGPGTVTVRFVRDGDVSYIPDGAEVAAVQAYIDAVRPVTAEVTVEAPAAQPVDFTIALTPDTADTRAAVLEELSRVLASDENEPGGTLLLTHLREAVSVAAGETDHVMTAPAANVVLPAGTMATLGLMTWM